jgi:hypothetical protein
MSKLIVNAVLEQDSKHRYNGVTEDLFTHEDLNMDITPQYDYPTLVNNVNFVERNSNFTFESFLINWKNKYPELNFVFDEETGMQDNILFAGGSISNLILNNNKVNDNDVDIFIYGLSENEANQKVLSVLNNIIYNINCANDKKYEADKKADTKGYVYKRELEYYTTKNNNVLTLVFESPFHMKYQIVFRLYSSISEILHGFDLGSSAIGFDGKDLLFTSLSKFAYEYRANIFDNTRRSTSYEYRLQKYFNRGFAIILPNLNINMMVNGNDNIKYNIETVCMMPYMIFTYNKIINNIIVVKQFLTSDFMSISDYDYHYDKNTYSVFYRNLYNINKKTGNYLSYNYCKVDIDSPIYFPYSVLDDYYNNLLIKMLRKRIEVPILQKTLPNVPLGELIQSIFESKSQIFGDLTEHKRKEYLTQIINNQLEDIKKIVEELSEKNRGIHWKKINPGSQITCSFNPIIDDPKKWYGKYFAE